MISSKTAVETRLFSCFFQKQEKESTKTAELNGILL